MCRSVSECQRLRSSGEHGQREGMIIRYAEDFNSLRMGGDKRRLGGQAFIYDNE